MSPKAPKTKRGELPKPQIQRGSLGYAPLNAFTFSCVHAGHGDRMLGFRDSEETLAFKARPMLQVGQAGQIEKDGKDRETYSLDGIFYNSYTDALYRGRLPEVLMAAPSAETLGTLLEDFLEYVEKLLALGFFVPRKEIVKRDPILDFIPCTVLAGEGMVFSRFITGLMRGLRGFEQQHRLMDETLRLGIVNRFVRGIPVGGEEIAAGSDLSGPCVTLVPVPKHFRIAGGNQQTRESVCAILGLHGLVASVESRVRNAAERLELESAMWRLSQVILPALQDGMDDAESRQNAGQTSDLTERVRSGILNIGRRRLAFEETEQAGLPSVLNNVSEGASDKTSKPSQVSGKSSNAQSKKTSAHASRPGQKTSALKTGPEDVALLHGLELYADALGLDEERSLFAGLAARLASPASE